MDVKNDLLSLISLFLPLFGVFLGWGLFVHGSFVPSQRTIIASIVIFGTSLLLFVSMGNFVETRSFVLRQARHKRKIPEQINRREDLDDSGRYRYYNPRNWYIKLALPWGVQKRRDNYLAPNYKRWSTQSSSLFKCETVANDVKIGRILDSIHRFKEMTVVSWLR